MSNTTIYLSQRINGGSAFSQEMPASAIAGHPYLSDVSAVAIYNGSDSHILRIKDLTTRPVSAEQNQAARGELVRITAASGGTLAALFPMDSNNAALPSQVAARVRPTSATVASGAIWRSISMTPTANPTRALSWWVCRTNGDSQTRNDSSEIVAHGRGNDTQGYRLREGEGIAWRLATTTPPHCYNIAFQVRDISSGESFLFSELLLPDGMSGPILTLLNGSGSGVVLAVTRVQVREVGTDETASIDYCLLDGLDAGAADATYVYDGSLPAGVLLKADAVGSRMGGKYGGVIASPKYRALGLTESTYGVAVSGGPNVCRRGRFSHDLVYTTDGAIVLRKGMGLGVVRRNASAIFNHEVNATIEVEDTTPAALSNTYSRGRVVNAGGV